MRTSSVIGPGNASLDAAIRRTDPLDGSMMSIAQRSSRQRPLAIVRPDGEAVSVLAALPLQPSGRGPGAISSRTDPSVSEIDTTPGSMPASTGSWPAMTSQSPASRPRSTSSGRVTSVTTRPEAISRTRTTDPGSPDRGATEATSPPPASIGSSSSGSSSRSLDPAMPTTQAGAAPWANQFVPTRPGGTNPGPTGAADPSPPGTWTRPDRSVGGSAGPPALGATHPAANPARTTRQPTRRRATGPGLARPSSSASAGRVSDRPRRVSASIEDLLRRGSIGREEGEDDSVGGAAHRWLIC
jgi:hypothetical protein